VVRGGGWISRSVVVTVNGADSPPAGRQTRRERSDLHAHRGGWRVIGAASANVGGE
jgi:hypothetical protein